MFDTGFEPTYKELKQWKALFVKYQSESFEPTYKELKLIPGKARQKS